MYVQSLYNELLLPGIEEFCQGFFPSLIEQVLDKQTSQHQPKELDAQRIAQSFLNKLYECLSVIEKDNDTQQNTNPCSKGYRTLPIEIEQYSEPAARKILGHGRNPFSPSHLQILIHETLIEARATNPDVIEQAILNEFQVLAEGFYRQLNNLYHAYATTSATITGSNSHGSTEQYDQSLNQPLTASSMDSLQTNSAPFTKDALNDHGLKWSRNEFLSEASASNKPLALSLAEAEESIQNTKHFFENELTLDAVGPRLYSVTRKLYIPILNRSLDVERPFLNEIGPNAQNPTAVDVNHPIEQLIHFIKKIGHAAQQSTDLHQANKLIKTTERVIGNFIQTSLDGEDTLEQAIAELEQLDSTVPLREDSSWSTAGTKAATSAAKVPDTPLLDTPLSVRSITAPINAHVPPTLHNKATETQKAPVFQEGQWFDYILEGGQVIRCRIAAIIRQTQQYVFVSRQGRKVLSLHQNDLSAYIEGGLLKQHINTGITGEPLDSSLEDVFSTIKKAHQTEKSGV